MYEETKFNTELIEAIDAYNRKNRNFPVTLTDVIREMGLKDPFVTKIKKGEYVPTKERIEKAAVFLGVSPSFFTLYAKRWVEAEILVNEDLLKFVRLVTSVSTDSARSLLIRGATRHIAGALDNSRQLTATA
jgi:transcriptional regulator with XRE-family HTH domain